MNFILDACVALTWCFSDESTPFSIELLESLDSETAFVPELFPLEIGNVLILAEKRKKITYPEINEFIELLEDINIEIDKETSSKAFHEILLLAHSNKLTTYDASYLELAMRLDLPLATNDSQLHKAAHTLGIKVLK